MVFVITFISLDTRVCVISQKCATVRYSTMQYRRTVTYRRDDVDFVRLTAAIGIPPSWLEEGVCSTYLPTAKTDTPTPPSSPSNNQSQLHEEIVKVKKEEAKKKSGLSSGSTSLGGAGKAASPETGVSGAGNEDSWLEVGKGRTKAVVNAPDPQKRIADSSVVRSIALVFLIFIGSSSRWLS